MYLPFLRFSLRCSARPPWPRSMEITVFFFRRRYVTVPLDSPQVPFSSATSVFVCFESLSWKRRRCACVDNDGYSSGIQLPSHDSASQHHHLPPLSARARRNVILSLWSSSSRLSLSGSGAPARHRRPESAPSSRRTPSSHRTAPKPAQPRRFDSREPRRSLPNKGWSITTKLSCFAVFLKWFVGCRAKLRLGSR